MTDLTPLSACWCERCNPSERRQKAPAPCGARVSLGGTSTTFRCCSISSFLCDHVGLGGNTCDLPLCEQHANRGRAGSAPVPVPRSESSRDDDGRPGGTVLKDTP